MKSMKEILLRYRGIPRPAFLPIPQEPRNMNRRQDDSISNSENDRVGLKNFDTSIHGMTEIYWTKMVILR